MSFLVIVVSVAGVVNMKDNENSLGFKHFKESMSSLHNKAITIWLILVIFGQQRGYKLQFYFVRGQQIQTEESGICCSF